MVAGDLIYSHEDSKDFARLLLLAPSGLEINGRLSWANRNGIPLFSIRPEDFSGLPDSEKWLSARALSPMRDTTERNSWLSEYRDIQRLLRERGTDIVLIKTDGPFPYWSGNIDALVTEERFDEALGIIKSKGCIRLPWLDEPYKVILKRFRAGNVVISLHLHARIFWNSTYLRDKDAMKESREVGEGDKIRTVGDGSLAAITLAHAFVENSSIRAIDLLMVSRALRNRKAWDMAAGIAATEGWSREHQLSSMAFVTANERISDIVGEDIFKLKDRIPIEFDSDRLHRLFISRIKDTKSLPMTLPRMITKGLSLKRTVLRPGIENLQGGHGGVTAASMMLKNYVLRKLGGDLVRGKSIAVSGPDGSGKTTIVHMLDSALHDIGVPSGIYWSRYSVAGRMVKGSFDGFARRTAEDTGRPRKRLPYENRIKLGMYAVQLCMKSVSARSSRKNIIFDRHFLDSQVDYILDSGSSDDPISSIGFGLVPKPDLHIVLLADPRILADRSKEGLDLSSRKAAAFEEVIAKRLEGRILRIDAARGTGEIIDELIPIIVDDFSQRASHG